MSKNARSIAARGLTRSNIGSEIRWVDGMGTLRIAKVEDVSYSPLEKRTVVKYSAIAMLNDSQQIEVRDV